MTAPAMAAPPPPAAAAIRPPIAPPPNAPTVPLLPCSSAQPVSPMTTSMMSAATWTVVLGMTSLPTTNGIPSTARRLTYCLEPRAHQAGNHHSNIKLTTDSFEHHDAPRHLALRHDVPIPEGRERHKAEVDRGGEREAGRAAAGIAERARPCALDAPMDDAEGQSRDQIGAQRGIDVLG